MAQHDHGYKLVFSHPEVVSDLLRGFVPQDWVARLDFASLELVRSSFVSEDLRGREDDVIWRARFDGEWLYVYILLEFQSTIDRFMALRLLTYVSLLYQDLVRSKQLAPKRRLPPVVPIVLYNGKKKWLAPTEMRDLVVPVPGQLGDFAPRMRYLLLDEHRLDLEGHGVKNLANALFSLERARSPDDILMKLGELSSWLKAPGQSALRRAFASWVKRVLSKTLGEEIDTEELSEVKSMLEQRVQEWFREWREQGLAEGRMAGREEGQLRGEANLLLRQLSRKFGDIPDLLEQRVTRAGFDELRIWGDRVLTADSLAEVFEI